MKPRSAWMLSVILVAGLAGWKTGAQAKDLEAKVEITSFGPVDSKVTYKLAEVCGKVTGMEGDFVPVRIVPDYNSANPANYMTFVAKDGHFCQVVMTLYGTVEVSLVPHKKQPALTVRGKMTQTLD